MVVARTEWEKAKDWNGGTSTAKETLWVMEQQNFSLVEQNIWLARYQIHNKQLQPQGCCKLNINCWPQSGIWVRGSVRVRKEPQQGASLKAGPTHYQHDLFLWHKMQACSPPQWLVKGLSLPRRGIQHPTPGHPQDKFSLPQPPAQSWLGLFPHRKRRRLSGCSPRCLANNKEGVFLRERKKELGRAEQKYYSTI